MRRINKGASPDWFEVWKADFRARNGREPEYKTDFDDDVRWRLRKDLLEEQGYICCYCMKKINNKTSHIEHFWPKSQFEEKDMDYTNMLASCQGDQGEEHCGHKKDNWYVPDMVIPTDATIEGMFSYQENGDISPKGENRKSWLGKQMIEHLALDSFHLVRNRRNAIEASEVYDAAEHDDAEIRDFIDYYDHKVDGKYVPFCQCIIDCLTRQLSE